MDGGGRPRNPYRPWTRGPFMPVDRDSPTLDLPLADESATGRLAERLAAVARAGDVIALSGPLGAGKTTFARAFVGALCRRSGRAPEEVPSPTFTLVQTYDFPGKPVYHFDLFRIESPDDALELGIEDAFAEGISLIEWPERLGGWLPTERLDVELAPGPDANARRARIVGHGGWRYRLKELSLDG